MGTLPLYQSHKKVRAAKIVGVSIQHASESVRLELEGGLVAIRGIEWGRRHEPAIGGYLVVYPDGHTSYSPAKAFEEGNARVEDAPAPEVAQPNTPSFLRGHFDTMAAEGRTLNPHYRVTRADVLAEVASEHYFTAYHGAYYAAQGSANEAVPDALARITFCVLVLKSGVTVTGTEHAQEGVELDEAIGRQGALEDAIWQAFPLVLHERKARIARGE